MNVERQKYWYDIAEYDFETAQAMYTTKRWLYVGFMCHQAIEKTLKGYWCGCLETDPPYTHNLLRLAEGCGIMNLLDDGQLSFITEMMPLNIEARYPEYKDSLSKEMSMERCQQIIDKTDSLIKWIRDKH